MMLLTSPGISSLIMTPSASECHSLYVMYVMLCKLCYVVYIMSCYVCESS